MRMIMGLSLACLLVASSALASPFTPDRFGLSVLQNPTIIPHATITLDGQAQGWWNPSGIEAGAALGTWLADTALEPGTFAIDVALALWNSAQPDLVSVTPGQITGTYGMDGFGLIHGWINTALLHAVSVAYPYEPNVPTHFIVLIDRPAATLNETAAVAAPEPATIWLLSAGAIGLARRHRTRRA